MRACLNLYIIKVMATIFSRIIAGEIPSYKVAEDDKFFAFLDINPLVKGHTLVVPKQEVDYIFDLDDEDLAAMHVFAKKVARAIAVSYTHLDVYKRQILDNGKEQCVQTFIFFPAVSTFPQRNHRFHKNIFSFCPASDVGIGKGKKLFLILSKETRK